MHKLPQSLVQFWIEYQISCRVEEQYHLYKHMNYMSYY